MNKSTKLLFSVIIFMGFALPLYAGDNAMRAVDQEDDRKVPFLAPPDGYKKRRRRPLSIEQAYADMDKRYNFETLKGFQQYIVGSAVVRNAASLWGKVKAMDLAQKLDKSPEYGKERLALERQLCWAVVHGIVACPSEFDPRVEQARQEQMEKYLALLANKGKLSYQKRVGFEYASDTPSDSFTDNSVQ